MVDDMINSMDMSLSKFWVIVKEREAWHAAVLGVSKSQTQLSDLTTTTKQLLKIVFKCVIHAVCFNKKVKEIIKANVTVVQLISPV